MNRKLKPEIGMFVVVRWHDSAQPQSPWILDSEPFDEQLHEIESAGWVFRVFPKTLVLAPNTCHDPEDTYDSQSCGHIRIVRCAILSIEEVRKYSHGKITRAKN